MNQSCISTILISPTFRAEMGMGHGSNGSPFWMGHEGQLVTASDLLYHDDEITAQYSLQF